MKGKSIIRSTNMAWRDGYERIFSQKEGDNMQANVDGKRYEWAEGDVNGGCSGCVAETDRDLCRDLPDCMILDGRTIFKSVA